MTLLFVFDLGLLLCIECPVLVFLSICMLLCVRVHLNSHSGSVELGGLFVEVACIGQCEEPGRFVGL